MKIARTIIVGVGLVALAACGSPESKFAKGCTAVALDEGMQEPQAKVTCNCAYDRLEGALSSGDMKHAAELINLQGEAATTYAAKVDGGDAIMEAVDGAIKSCAM